jgi:hypothetical protein
MPNVPEPAPQCDGVKNFIPASQKLQFTFVGEEVTLVNCNSPRLREFIVECQDASGQVTR